MFIYYSHICVLMMLSRTELEFLSEVGKGTVTIPQLAKALDISISQTYRQSQSLHRKGIINYHKGMLSPEKKTHVSMLLQLLARAPNLSKPFSGTGLQIYTTLLQPKTVSDIKKETTLHKNTITKKIREGRQMSLLIKEGDTYRLNEKLWTGAREFLQELQRFEHSFDERIPSGAVIYRTTPDDIVFSTKEIIDAEKTAFSAYDKYGVGLLLITTYYTLPKRTLSLQNIFLHSLFVAEKDPDPRYIIMIALLYAKHKKELARTHHPILEKIKKVLSGETISTYPTLNEIKDRAKLYHVKVLYD